MKNEAEFVEIDVQISIKDLNLHIGYDPDPHDLPEFFRDLADALEEGVLVERCDDEEDQNLYLLMGNEVYFPLDFVLAQGPRFVRSYGFWQRAETRS